MNPPGNPADSRSDADFTELYEQYYGAVWAYASACVGDDDADDVVAETFIVALRRQSEVPADWTRSWLIGVARNVVRSRKRARRRATDFVSQLQALSPQSEPGADASADSQLALLHAAMATLKSSDQEVLLFAGPYDMSLDEIALALDITSNAAGVRVHRARERLRTAFDKQSARQGGEAA